MKRPELRSVDRSVLVALASLLPNWRSAVLLVKPQTVLRWHQEGFRLFWRRRAKPTKLRESGMRGHDPADLPHGSREPTLERGTHPRRAPQAWHRLAKRLRMTAQTPTQ